MEPPPVKEVLGFFVRVVVVLLIVGICWFVLWKFILEQNPLIRDFFDLDKPAPRKGKKTK
jgi:hypothetical protein